MLREQAAGRPSKGRKQVKKKGKKNSGEAEKVEKNFTEKYFKEFIRCMMTDFIEVFQEEKVGTVDPARLKCRYVGVSEKAAGKKDVK